MSTQTYVFVEKEKEIIYLSGPSCSNLTMSLVNVSLKL